MNYKKLIGFVFLLLISLVGVNAITTDTLTSYWIFDNIVTDVHSTNDYINNGATYTASGKINGAYSYVTNDEMTTSYTLTTNSPWTIGGWFYFNDVSTSNMAIIDATNSVMYLKLKDTNQGGVNGRLTFYSVLGAGDVTTLNYDGLTTGTWYHIIATHNQGEQKLYVNGALVASDVNSGTGGYSASPKLGNDAYGGYFNGRIDELGYWQVVLTTTNVTDLYNGGLGLAYPFDDIIITPTIEFEEVKLNNVPSFNNSYYNSTPQLLEVTLNTTDTNNNTNVTLYLYNSTNSLITTNQFITNNLTGSYNLSMPYDDIFKFYLYAFNNETNATIGNYTITLDTLSPNISIIGNLSQNVFEIDFSTIFNITDLNLDTCTIDITYLENITNASQYDTLINCTDTELFLAAGLYNGFITATDLAGNVATLSVNGTIEPIIYINFKDIYGNNITNYDVRIIHDGEEHPEVINTNNPLEVSPVFNGTLHLGNYTFIFDKAGYQLQNFTIVVNETSGGIEYNFTVGFSQISVNVYDRDTLALLTQLVNFELLNNGGNPYGAIFNTSTGNATFINNSFLSGDYVLRATSSGYNFVEYYFTYSGQENATINLYMVNASKVDDNNVPVIVDVKIVIQDAAGFDVGAGYILKVLQQYASEGGGHFHSRQW